ncbi:winged helix-turn-helix transcriptional regulator [Pantoea sp. ICBG 985]|nr:winged helix-turn-helix transcriptional regulator [Pantoea sp. ICBG 985]
MDTTVDRNTPYTNRPWIISALSLRYNDALTYREIAEKLNISASATHKMFTRFRRTGIAWPLPADYTPEKLEAELYAFNLETNQPVKKRRPDWPLEFKIRMAELSLQPGICVAELRGKTALTIT